MMLLVKRIHNVVAAEIESGLLKIIHSHIIWVNANSTWHSRQRITRQRIRSMKRWDAFVSKMKQWESISL